MPPSSPPHPLAKPLPAEIRVPYRFGGGRVGIGPAFASERPSLIDLETQSRRGTIEVGSGRWRDPLGRDGSASAAEVVRFLRSFQTHQEREGGDDLVTVDFGAQKTLRIDSLSSQLATAQVELARLETEIMKIQRAYEAAEKLEQRKRNYLQAKTPMGENVYRLKDDADTGELPHNACPHCFQEDKIRILQLRGAILKCDACKTMYRNTESSGVAVTRHNRDHPSRGF